MSSRNSHLATKPPSVEPLTRVRASLAEYVRHVRMFSRNARLYLTGSFLMAINFAVFQLLFNLYLRENGFAESAIGQVLSARGLGMVLIAVPAALLLSRIRLKPVLLLAGTLFAFFSAGMCVFLDLSHLRGLALLVGMAFSFYRVASGPFYMRNSSRLERTHLFSFSFAMMILANMVGSAGSGNLVTLMTSLTGDLILGYRYTLLLGILVGLTALIPFSMIKAAAPSAEENRITLTLSQLKRRGRFYVKISSANLLIGLGAGLIIPFLNLFFRDRFDLPPDRIGWYFFAVSCSMFFGTLSGPVLAKRLGLVRTIVITQLASIPFMFVLAYSYVLPLVVAAFVLRGGLMNLGVPISTNFGMEMAEKNEQGLVNALLMVSWTGSWMLSALIGGFVIERFGYTVALNVSIVLYVFSSLVYWGFFRNAERKREGARGWVIPERSEL
ncbi:MAG TPA: MFS transporter [Acidobacteriota bacterium]|nr:MFS transporter [Acidobacteriota bacterium]